MDIVRTLTDKQLYATVMIMSQRVPIYPIDTQIIQSISKGDSQFWLYKNMGCELSVCCYFDEAKIFCIPNFYGSDLEIKEASQRKQRFMKFEKKSQGPIPDEERKIDEFYTPNKQDSIQADKTKIADTEYKPKLLIEYGRSINGLGKLNSSNAFYRYPHKTLKWYRTIVN
jgi:hypothetical protein